jgi:hypothetical protein
MVDNSAIELSALNRKINPKEVFNNEHQETFLH